MNIFFLTPPRPSPKWGGRKGNMINFFLTPPRPSPEWGGRKKDYERFLSYPSPALPGAGREEERL